MVKIHSGLKHKMAYDSGSFTVSIGHDDQGRQYIVEMVSRKTNNQTIDKASDQMNQLKPPIKNPNPQSISAPPPSSEAAQQSSPPPSISSSGASFQRKKLTIDVE